MRISILANSMRRVDETVTAPHMYIIREIYKRLNVLGHSATIHGFNDGSTHAQCVYQQDWSELSAALMAEAKNASLAAAREMPAILQRLAFVREATHCVKAFQAANRDSDVMHLHWSGHMFGATVSEIPIVYSVRHGYNDPECFLRIKEMAFSQVIELKKFFWVVLSSPQIKFLPVGIPEDRIHVIPHGLNFAQFPKEPAPKQGYVAFLGRIMRLKAPHLAIDAAKLANVPIKVAGGYNPSREGEPDYFAEEIEPRLGPGVEYLGEIGFKDKIELLQGAIAVVNPFQLEEPFGQVNTESLACGTPLVVPKRGSVLDIVRQGMNGFYADYSPESMATAIQQCRDLDSRRIQADVRERFSSEAMVDSYVDVYRQAVELGCS